jgi:hypothetical protein
MVDIRSIAGSSRPSRREQGNGEEVTSRSRAGRSHRTNPRCATMAVAATTTTTRRQPSAGTTVMMPPAVDPEGTLEAARTLCHNPPGTDASPSVAEQWRNDVDQLVVAAINMRLHEGRWANHYRGSP